MTNNAINSQINSVIIDSSLAGASNVNMPSSEAIKNYVDSKNSGNILQIQRTTSVNGYSTSTTFPFDATIPQQTEGEEYFTVTITPQSATSTLFVHVYIPVIAASSGVGFVGAIFRDSDLDAISAGWGIFETTSFYDLSADVISGSLTPTTFKFRWGRGSVNESFARCNQSNLGHLYSTSSIASITVTEVQL